MVKPSAASFDATVRPSNPPAPTTIATRSLRGSAPFLYRSGQRDLPSVTTASRAPPPSAVAHACGRSGEASLPECGDSAPRPARFTRRPATHRLPRRAGPPGGRREHLQVRHNAVQRGLIEYAGQPGAGGLCSAASPGNVDRTYARRCPSTRMV
jgi:hypothetical protein